jgi:hypothetical protein
MALLIKHNIKSLAKAVTPGINSLVAQELDHIVEEAIALAMTHIRKEITSRVAYKVKTSVQNVLSSDGTDVYVNCEVTVK